MEQHESEPQFVVRITPENAKLLAEVRREVNPNDSKSDTELTQEAEKYAQGSDRQAYIFQEQGKALGYVEVVLNEMPELPEGITVPEELIDFAHLARIGRINDAVAEERGIGAQLLAKAEDWAKEKGRTGIWLDYLDDNVDAKAFYEKHGYQEVVSYIDNRKGKDQVRIIAVKKF